MWDVQRLVHEYNLFHLITISVADCFPDKILNESIIPINKNIPTDLYSIALSNIDSLIVNQTKSIHQNNLRDDVFINYYSLRELAKSINNNLTNIVNSGSKGNIDNIIQILMSVGFQTVLSNCYIRNSYSKGLTAKELFIHSKSGRVGIISTSLNTSSTGYLQRELVKSMEDLTVDENGIVHDYTKNKICYYPFATNTQDIDDNVLEYIFAISNN